MCMFCVIQKWSRRVATMLPWLVIPLIGLWALSQLLPPAFRFEITSPRLACVFVLLVTLFWYEVLMPQLSAWRVRRNALLRERKRVEALELQKMKKTATRKCRNCLTPYKDQNPGGGKFMCSYCGHISKRPVLDLPVPPGMSSSGLIKELFGKGGKILNGRSWSDNVSLCNQEWLENGNWVVNGSFPANPSYQPRKNGVALFGISEPCLAEKSCFFVCKLLMSLFLGIRWLWRKLFRISSSDDSSSDANLGMLAKKGENGGTGSESRSEKARRKAEEKKQARLEKEILEEEERKQREEVARLVEERRRLRDEMLEAENRAKGVSSLREKDNKKETERRRKEQRKEHSKEKDKGSSKSNSDVDELDRKTGKDNERKRDTDKKSENGRRGSPKTDAGHETKGSTPNNISRGNVGSRYFDRVKGTFLSSSKAFTGSGFFGKASPNPNPTSKEIKPNNSVDYSLFPNSRRDIHPAEHLPGKIIMNGDDKVNLRPVTADSQHKTTQMSWHQLFARGSPANSNVISRPSAKAQAESQSSHLPCSVSSAPLYNNPIDLPSPFTLPPFSSAPLSNTASLSSIKDPLFQNRIRDLLPEEPELFEDPCYEPDPVSLLGPVSESLDNFQLDRGGSFVHDEFRNPCRVIRASSPPEISRPSPIESPLSRLRVADEKQNNSSHFFGSPKALDMHSFPASDLNNHNDSGTWHMWNSSSLGPDGLNLVGNTTNWVNPLDRSRLNNEEMLDHLPPRTMASLFSKDGHIFSGTHSSEKVLMGNAQNSNGFGAFIPSSNDQDPWLQKATFPPLSASDKHIPISPTEGASQKKMVYGSTKRVAASTGFDPSSANCWSKSEWSGEGSGDGVKNSSTVRSHVGGLYSVPDVQSLWSFE